MVTLDVDSWWQTNIGLTMQECNDKSSAKTTLGLIIEKDEEYILSIESIPKENVGQNNKEKDDVI